MWAWVKENGTGLLAIAAVSTLLFSVVNARIDTKFAAMNQRFDDLIQSMNQRFEAVDQRMDRMTDSIDALRGDPVRLGERVPATKVRWRC